MSDPAVLLATERARLARLQLTGSITELRARLSPTVIATNVIDNLRVKGSDAVEIGVETLRENRWTVAGIATIAGLFLARKPIAAMLHSGNEDETSGAPARLTRKTAKAKDSE